MSFIYVLNGFWHCVCVSCSVVSDPLQPHGLVACQAPSVHGIIPQSMGLFLAWITPGKDMEWVAISFSRGSTQPRDQTQVSHVAGQTLYHLSHQGNWYSLSLNKSMCPFSFTFALRASLNIPLVKAFFFFSFEKVWVLSSLL